MSDTLTVRLKEDRGDHKAGEVLVVRREIGQRMVDDGSAEMAEVPENGDDDQDESIA